MSDTDRPREYRIRIPVESFPAYGHPRDEGSRMQPRLDHLVFTVRADTESGAVSTLAERLGLLAHDPGADREPMPVCRHDAAIRGGCQRISCREPAVRAANGVGFCEEHATSVESYEFKAWRSRAENAEKLVEGLKELNASMMEHAAQDQVATDNHYTRAMRQEIGELKAQVAKLGDMVHRVRAALDGPEPTASVYGIGTANAGRGGMFVGKSDGGVMGTGK
jgi:HAMP domain-containing protein